uniref:N-acetylneuraminate synthase n=1 Tax=Latimeria chalumnae TaxID=7897 RepID=H3AN25_LATCH
MPLELELCPGRMIGGDHPCFIIAEIGQNHQGDIKIAKEMIRKVKVRGMDCFSVSQLKGKFLEPAKNRPSTSKPSYTRSFGKVYNHFWKTLAHEKFLKLQDYSSDLQIKVKISWFVSQMAVEFLHQLNVPFFKVGSGDTNNFTYLERTAQKGRPMVISSGMQSMETMRRVYQTVKPLNPNFCILQCTAYPLEPEDVNLRIITTNLEGEFLSVVFNRVMMGTLAWVQGLALGFYLILREVAIYMSGKSLPFPSTVLPSTVSKLILLGGEYYCLLPQKDECLFKLGKSVVAKVAICTGTVLTADMFTVKVADPKGIAPEDLFQLVGKKATADIGGDESVTEDAVENHGKKGKC